jgi:putative DNA methylase
MSRPRLLIEDWLPAQAIGVECMRERGSASALAPHTFLHVWWARRPLTASRAAVLGSLLPSNFDRETFERLLGFGRPSSEIVSIRERMDVGEQVEGGFGCSRAFTNPLREDDLNQASAAMARLWGDTPSVIDPMAGGGSIPLEAARLGLDALANEYNPVACAVLEATVDYPLSLGSILAAKARKWGKVWEERVATRLAGYYPKEKLALVHAYIYARTVPCPDTGHPTPLVPDWSLLHPQGGRQIVAEPVVDRERGLWSTRIREVGKGAGQLRQPPPPTYARGKGVSLFTNSVIPDDYIKATAQQGNMGNALYAVALKATSKLTFRPPESADLIALNAAEAELARLRPPWEEQGLLPTERKLKGQDDRSYVYGFTTWQSLFSPRQLLGAGLLVQELRDLRPQILREEGESGEAVVQLLALSIDKLLNHNCIVSKWECTRGVIKGMFDRHNYAFRCTFGELALCGSGDGLKWALDNVIEAYERISTLPRAANARPATITQGSATSLLELEDESVTAVVVDPPYADNVQYSELANFFYVWLKRTQGHRRPEWFSTYLCDDSEEAVVNIARHRSNGQKTAAQARTEANVFYQRMMARVFKEARRVLRDDGAFVVMFTHKQQSAWAALFESLIGAGFTITATWPIQTESQHSLHQAKRNAAQSTVLLVARKREAGSGRGFYDDAMRAEIVDVARATAARLKSEGLNAVDQLVGAFGPAMEVFSRYDEVKTDTGEKVSVGEAIQQAADAVAKWRVEQLASRGLDGVDAESRFVLLCWDVLGAAEFRFNEAMLLGKAVGIDVARLKETGLASATGDKVKLLPARERRRDRPIRTEQEQLDLLGESQRGRTRPSRKVHPNDEFFVSAIDMCHALALKHADNGGGQAGIGAARGMVLQQGWGPDSPCAKLMTALVNAAPVAVHFPGKGRTKTAADEFPEFRAWHAMLKPLFGITPPEWTEPKVLQATLITTDEEDEDEEDEEEAEE